MKAMFMQTANIDLWILHVTAEINIVNMLI